MKEAVIVDGVRTPFLKSNGAFKDLMAHDLGRIAIAGLLAKSGVDPKKVELVVMGTVVQDPRTSNLARESALGAGFDFEGVSLGGRHVGDADGLHSPMVRDACSFGDLLLGNEGALTTYGSGSILVTR